MSGFVDKCRKEWRRLGVPEDVANEMAADLAADLAEAETEGVSAEHVLGDAVFDARSFAASWAEARGVIPSARPARPMREVRWTVVVRAVVSLVLASAGLAIIVRGVSSCVLRVGTPICKRPPIFPFFPGFSVSWIVGVALLVVGFVGAALTIWYWSRSAPPGGVRIDDNIDQSSDELVAVEQPGEARLAHGSISDSERSELTSGDESG